MQVWQFQEAKAKLTQLIREAKREPQIISHHGINEMVVISIEQYDALLGHKKDLASFFKKSPLYGVDWEPERDRSSTRDIDFSDE